ncbi:MAG: alpha-amylase family glycosyl hydrolase [Bellilinea sp.]
MLEEAHKREIRVVLDGVFNHASRGFYQFQQTLENGAGSPYVDWFHFSKKMLERKIPFGAYPYPEQQALLDSGKSSLDILGYRAWYNLPALPKFNTDTPAMREFLWGVAEYWIKFGIDGWRFDVAKEIDDDSFCQEFRSRVKALNPDAYIVGELWEESQRWLQGDQFDAAMNYLLTAAVMVFFIKDMDHQIFEAGEFNKYLHSLNAEEFAKRIEYLLEIYDPAINGVMLNSLDSHDTPRFITTARNDQSAYDMATLFLFTFPGAPCLYYGDEIGLNGKNDPECRKAFPWDSNHWNHKQLEDTKRLIDLRNSCFHRLLHDEIWHLPGGGTADVHPAASFILARDHFNGHHGTGLRGDWFAACTAVGSGNSDNIFHLDTPHSPHQPARPGNPGEFLT